MNSLNRDSIASEFRRGYVRDLVTGDLVSSPKFALHDFLSSSLGKMSSNLYRKGEELHYGGTAKIGIFDFNYRLVFFREVLKKVYLYRKIENIEENSFSLQKRFAEENSKWLIEIFGIDSIQESWGKMEAFYSAQELYALIYLKYI